MKANRWLLVVAGMMVLSLNLMAQGTPHVVYGLLHGADGFPPDPICVAYKAYYIGNPGNPDDTLYYIYPGSATACTLGVDGIWAVQTAPLNPPDGSTLRVDFEDTCDNEAGYVEGVINYGLPSQDFGTTTMSSLPVDELRPPSARISRIYPNPFNKKLRLNLPPGEFRVEIYDILGNPIWRINSASNCVVWGGSRTDGVSVVSGIYFVRMQNLATGEAEVRKVLYEK